MRLRWRFTAVIHSVGHLFAGPPASHRDLSSIVNEPTSSAAARTMPCPALPPALALSLVASQPVGTTVINNITPCSDERRYFLHG